MSYVKQDGSLTPTVPLSCGHKVHLEGPSRDPVSSSLGLLRRRGLVDRGRTVTSLLDGGDDRS